MQLQKSEEVATGRSKSEEVTPMRSFPERGRSQREEVAPNEEVTSREKIRQDIVKKKGSLQNIATGSSRCRREKLQKVQGGKGSGSDRQ